MRANGAETMGGAQSSAQAGAMRLRPPVIEMRHFELSIASARNETGGKW
jgi:hypothetical protein